MAFDQRAIAVNWARADENASARKKSGWRNTWARHPMAHPWKVVIKQPPPGVVLFGDLYIIL